MDNRPRSPVGEAFSTDREASSPSLANPADDPSPCLTLTLQSTAKFPAGLGFKTDGTCETGSPFIDEITQGGWKLDADGMLAIPAGPGLGLTLDRGAVRKYTRGEELF